MSKAPNSQRLNDFLATGKRLNFVRKQIILQDSPDIDILFYWLISGYVKVCSYADSGSERIHYIYGPNDLFPIGWLLTGSPQWISFVALSDVQIISKTREDYHKFIATEPLLLSEITRLQLNAHDRIYNLGLDSPEDRIAHCLLMLAIRFGDTIGSHVKIDVPLSQQEFANMARMSRETAGKVLNELEEKGYLILGRKRIMIDIEKLSKSLEN